MVYNTLYGWGNLLHPIFVLVALPQEPQFNNTGLRKNAKILPKKGGAPLVRIGFLVFPSQFKLTTDATICPDGYGKVVPMTSISQCADRKHDTARFYYRKVEPQ